VTEPGVLSEELMTIALENSEYVAALERVFAASQLVLAATFSKLLMDENLTKLREAVEEVDLMR